MTIHLYWYIYFIHEDGDMMLFVRVEDDEATCRFTPYHRVTADNMPRLFRSAQAAQLWITRDSPFLFELQNRLYVGAWHSVEQIHTNPYGEQS